MSQFSYSSPKETAEALKKGGVLIDVREPGEFQTESVEGSINIPLSSFGATYSKLKSSETTYVLCQVGARAASAAAHLAQKGFPSVIVVSGGINAWKHEDLPTMRGARHIWPMERQVRFAAGLLILTGIGLSFINPWFLGISAFVGCGLVFSGLTGWCGMALILAHFPWNKNS